MTVATYSGLRERKKCQTRRAISDAATRLFIEHGFEPVSLAQIADAADVSVKTIFNYFGSKEELFFDRAGEIRDSLVRTIVHRPASMTVLDALQALLTDNWLLFDGDTWEALTPERFHAYVRFLSTQEQSPALRARRLVLAQEVESALAVALAGQLGRDPEAPEICVLAAMVGATLELRNREFTAAALVGCAPEHVRGRVTPIVDQAFRRLAAAFADLVVAETAQPR